VIANTCIFGKKRAADKRKIDLQNRKGGNGEASATWGRLALHQSFSALLAN